MIGQQEIIKALHDNTCPKCTRKFMYAATRGYSLGVTKYYVGCRFCSASWEITKETFENKVRIKDTFSYKQDKGW